LLQPESAEIVYVLSQALNDQRTLLKVESFLVQPLAKGGYGKPAPLPLVAVMQNRYCKPEDVTIHHGLSFVRAQYANQQQLGNAFPLVGPIGADLLKQVIDTGRCHWASPQNPALKLGESRKAQLEWIKEPSGLQRVNCRVQGESPMILVVSPPWYLDQQTHHCGPIDTGLAPDMAAALLLAPSMKPEQITHLYRLLADRSFTPSSSAPEEIIAIPTIPDHYIPYAVVEEPDTDWYVSLDEDMQRAWFDLELGVMIDGTRTNLLPLLVDSIRKGELTTGENWIVRLSDGRMVSIPLDRIRNILNVLIELHERDALTPQGKLRLSSLHAAQLASLETSIGVSHLNWFGGERLLALGEKLHEFNGIQEVSVPVDFLTELRPYQQVGLDWLQFLREYDLGGILADDMGLGKTVQALAHLLLEKKAGRMDRPSLVIAPTSLMTNWRLEAQRFAPDLRVLVLHGSDRKRHFGQIKEYDLILTTYPLLVRDIADLQALEYHLLILDEAQVIKNPLAKATHMVRCLQARHRLCLTGTPMENHLGELWSLFHFLMPGLLGERRQFNRLFRVPIEKNGDVERRQLLVKRISPFLLRRTKESVATELPPKTEITQTIELAGGQRDLYESIRLSMHHKVTQAIQDKGLGRSQIVILDALLKLRQICCDPRLLKLDSAKKFQAGSAKLELLMEMLVSLVEEGRRILLFSQFTSMLELIEAEVKRKGINYVVLTGKTQNRAVLIDEFQTGTVPLFLISLKAGGTGLNLTAADTVIHYDPWWNPAVEQQATDRAYRIGQDKPVFVYKLLTAGTVEEKILALQQKKQALMQGLFSNEEQGSTQLTKEDFESLFEPLG
jgi:superfamily II DNA or RNA helicase